MSTAGTTRARSGTSTSNAVPNVRDGNAAELATYVVENGKSLLNLA